MGIFREAQTAHGSPETKNQTRFHAWKHAERARPMSVNMGYYWGKVDAEEVMENLEGIENDRSEV